MDGGSQKLSERELCEFFRRIDIDVSEAELKCPTKDFIHRVLHQLLLLFKIDLNRQDLPPWQAFEKLDNPEYYEGARQTLMLTLAVNKILQPCAMKITIADILEPKPKKTKKMMNHLIVFFNYYLEKTVHFFQLEKKKEDEFQHFRVLTDEIDQMNQQIEEKQKMLNVLKRDEEELLSTIAADEDTVEKYMKKNENYNSCYQDLKAKEISLTKKMADLDVEIANRKVKLEEFGHLILNSPDRMNSEIASLKERVKDVSNKIKEVELKANAKKKDLSKMEALQNEACNLKILSDVKSDLETLSQTATECPLTQRKIQDEEKQLEEIKLKIDNINNEKHVCEREAAKVNLHFRKKKEVLEETIKLYKSQIESEEASSSSVHKQNDDLKNNLKTLEEKVAEKTKQLEAMKSEMKKKAEEFTSNMTKMKSDHETDVDETMKLLKGHFQC